MLPSARCKTAKPGTAEFRTALRDAILSTKELPGVHAIYNFKPGAVTGVDERSLVVVRLTGGSLEVRAITGSRPRHHREQRRLNDERHCSHSRDRRDRHRGRLCPGGDRDRPDLHGDASHLHSLRRHRGLHRADAGRPRREALSGHGSAGRDPGLSCDPDRDHLAGALAANSGCCPARCPSISCFRSPWSVQPGLSCAWTRRLPPGSCWR